MDGWYILTGSTISYRVGFSDVWPIKTDQQGNTIGSKTYGDDDSDWGNAVHQISSGGYIIIGGIRSFGFGDMDIWLIETDNQGNMRLSKTYGVVDYEYTQAGH